MSSTLFTTMLSYGIRSKITWTVRKQCVTCSWTAASQVIREQLLQELPAAFLCSASQTIIYIPIFPIV